MIFFENLLNAIEKSIPKENETIIRMEEGNLENNNISREEWELANKLKAVEEFTIDRFEENIAILENRQTGEMIEVAREQLPESIKEGDLLKKINGKYIVDKEKTEETAKRIEEKMKNLWQ